MHWDSGAVGRVVSNYKLSKIPRFGGSCPGAKPVCKPGRVVLGRASGVKVLPNQICRGRSTVAAERNLVLYSISLMQRSG